MSSPVRYRKPNPWRWAPAGVIALLGCALQLGAILAGSGADEGDAVLVPNPGEPAAGTDTLHLRELWRAGGDDDEVFFGVINAVTSDSEGNLYLLDYQLCEIPVYSPRGEYLRTLSREGDGPGEIRRPADMCLMPDGSLGIGLPVPGRVVMIDSAGSPLSTLTLGESDPTERQFIFLQGLACHGNRLVVSGTQINRQAGARLRTHILAAYDLNGAEQVRYLAREDHRQFGEALREADEYTVAGGRWAVGPEGQVYLAPERDRYRIEVFAPTGRCTRVIEREFEPRRRAPSEIERVRSRVGPPRRRRPGRGPAPEVEVAACDPVINRLRVTSGGELWVLHSRSNRDQPPGIMETYDIFNDAGCYIRRMAIACEGDGLEDRLFFVADDRAVLVRGLRDARDALRGVAGEEVADEEAPPLTVICYALDRTFEETD
jgi:hypothetical protein